MRDDLIKDKSLDIFGQAQNYTKPKSKAEKAKAAQQLVQTIADEIAKPIAIPSEPAESTAEVSSVDIPEVVSAEPTSESASAENASSSETIVIPSIETEVRPNATSTYKLVINGVSESTNKGLYSLICKPDGKYYATINLSNGFFSRFRECLSSDDNIKQLAYFIRNLVVTELLLIESGIRSATSFRNKFNQLFGLI